MNSKTVDAYNKIAQHYSETHYGTDFWLDEFKLFQQLANGRKIIDIGCGAGRDAELFVKNNFDYMGIDASEGMLNIARQRVKNGKFLLMDFNNVSLPQKSFDGFWAAASLLHVPKNKIEEVLLRIRYIIKSSGIGFISLKKQKDVGEGLIKQEKFGIERYFSFYTPEEFHGILKQAGFVVLEQHEKREADGTDWLCFFIKNP